jgi:hypothetical protein
MSLPHDALYAFQDPWRNNLAIEARDAVTFIGPIQPRIGQPVAVANAHGKQPVA